MTLDIQRSFCLYADCSIIYDGRAYSELIRGNYLVIKKNDNSVQIHGGNKIPPRNYQGSKSKLIYDGNTLFVSNKKEEIKIELNNIISINYLDLWSESEISIFKTESDLVQKLVSSMSSYVTDEIIRVEKEYKTRLGPIDIAVIGKNYLHLIEVKRNPISSTNVYQLKRYIDCVEEKKKAYIAGPSIKANAREICSINNIEYIQVGF